MRNLRVKTIVSATLGLALVVAGMPGTAEAGVCSTVGEPAGCVNSKDVKDNRLQAADLKDEAGADFVNPAVDFENFPLTGTPAVFKTVTVTAPAAGLIMVNASGIFDNGANADIGSECSISTGASLDFKRLTAVFATAADLPFALTTVFPVAAGSFTVNLVCVNLDAVADILFLPSLNAVYVPTTY